MARITLLCLSVLAVGVSTLSLARSHAYASDLAIEWTAPRGCPPQDALREGLSARLGREISVGAEAPVEVHATIVAVGGGYSLDLRMHSAQGSERRELRARSCNELARASVLMAALLLMDTPGATVTGEIQPKRRSRPASNASSIGPVYARTWVRGDLGTMPAAAVGPGIAVGLALSDTRLELGATYLPAQSMYASGGGDSLGSVQLMAAHANLCQVLLRVPELGPCLRAEVGQLRARGEHVASAMTASSAWFSGAIGARLGVELWSGLAWQTEVAAGMPFERVRVAVRNSGELHRTAAVFGRVETGLLLSF
jgi:hypothetical protein